MYLHEAISKAKSQKAKGVLGIAYHSHCGLLNSPFGLYRPHATIFPYAYTGDFPHFLGQIGLFSDAEYFARPCPLRPRHGFVESRRLQGLAPLEALLRETRNVEPDAEILVMPVYSGTYSAVATASGVAWGQGNDGATAGKGAKYIPTPCSKHNWESFFNRDALALKANPFLEIVENNGLSMLVQVRDGPELPTTENFIPHWAETMPVHTILTLDSLENSENDGPEALLEWEKIVEDAIKTNDNRPEGIVVYLPNHTLGSHFAVHGVQNGMAVVCSKAVKDCPIEGKLLAIPVSDIGGLNKADLRELRDRIDFLKNQNINSEAEKLVKQAIASLHSMALWDNSPHFHALRAAMVVTIARCLAAACIGEDRYFYGNGPGGRSDGERPCDDPDCDVCNELKEKLRQGGFRDRAIPHVKRYRNRDVGYSREMAYMEMFAQPWHSLTADVTDARRDFQIPGWRSSFGGRNWANCATAGLKLIKRIDNFLVKPTPYQWKLLMGATNKGVNVVHNSGSCLTKWTDKSTMNWLSKCPVTGFLTQITPKTIGA